MAAGGAGPVPSESTPPTTQPAEVALTETQAPPKVRLMPRRLGLSIQTSLDAFQGESAEPLSMYLELALATEDDQVGPPFLEAGGSSWPGSPWAPSAPSAAEPSPRLTDPPASVTPEG